VSQSRPFTNQEATASKLINVQRYVPDFNEELILVNLIAKVFNKNLIIGVKNILKLCKF